MRFLPQLLALLATIAAALPAAAAAEPAVPPAKLVRAELLQHLPADGGARLGVRLRIAEGWHTYWRNPGDSGLATKIEWELPPGYLAGPVEWPTPQRFEIGESTSFGYANEVLLLAPLQLPAGLRPGDELPISAMVSWLVCKEECIPGSATLTGMLRPGALSPAIAAEAARLPAPAPWPVELHAEGEELVLHAALPEAAAIRSAFFFPEQPTAIEHGAAQELSQVGDGLRLRMQRSALAAAEPAPLAGVLVLEAERDGTLQRQAFAIDAPLAPPPAAAALDAPPAAAPPAAAPAAGLLEILGLALLGGIVLNLMPCVFPVLSLKVLGVAQQAAESKRRIRLHGIAYTAGILASFAALAGALLLLRAGGAQIGWGFQLQSPAFVAILAYVLFAMALSLSGVLHFGGSIAGVGNSLASRPGLTGSFFTGVLATVVATPCTAPFMGAAIGYALVMPAATALAVFLALGFGLALPFLLLSFAPALHRFLPRPGQWMETMKQALAFPLYGTVAWLIWVLAQQAGSIGLAAALAGLVFVALAAWAWGASRLARATMRRIGAGVALAATIAAFLLVRLQVGGAPGLAVAHAEQAAEPWSEERVEALLAEGKPVFVNFTAAWCVTCLANERTALGTAGVQTLFQEEGITYLKGDWTNEDPAITRALERFGRSGVPLYLLYRKGREPVVLPQILTEQIVREHVRLPGGA